MRRMVNGSIFQLVGVNRYDVPAFTHDVSSMPPLHHTSTATYGEHDAIQSKHSSAQGRCLERNTLPDLRHSTDDALAFSWAHLDTQIYESKAYRNAPFRARQHELITGYATKAGIYFMAAGRTSTRRGARPRVMREALIPAIQLLNRTNAET